MNTYFSSSIENPCHSGCSFQSCPERYLCKLREIPTLSDISPLPSGTVFQPTITSPLRSGDLLIFHAESRNDLDQLVKNRKTIEQFRLVLIIGDEAYHNSRSYHQLNPRFIMTSKQNVTDLKDVVGKITGQTSIVNQKNHPVDDMSSQPFKGEII